MPVSPHALSVLNEIAGSKRTGDAHAAFDEIKAFTLAACAALSQQAWLIDGDELEKHLTTLSDALDCLDGAA